MICRKCYAAKALSTLRAITQNNRPARLRCRAVFPPGVCRLFAARRQSAPLGEVFLAFPARQIRPHFPDQRQQGVADRPGSTVASLSPHWRTSIACRF